MKFRLTDEYIYWWPVKVDVPSADHSGKIETQTFEMRFQAMPDDEVKRLEAEFAAITDPAERALQEHAHLQRICRDWRGVMGDDDKEQPFTSDALRQALRYPFFRVAIMRAYSASIAGDRARLGN